MDIIDKLMMTCFIVFYTLFIGRTLLLMKQGIKPFVLAKGKKGIKRIIELLFAVGLILWSLEIVFHSMKIDFHLVPTQFIAILFNIMLLKILGTIIIMIGLVILTLSFIAFGKSWRVGIDKENAGELVKKGIFSLTRNPIFLFIDIYYIGTFLVYPNIFFLILMILTITGMHYQIIQEEYFLLSQYGDEYKNYMNKVRRYL